MAEIQEEDVLWPATWQGLQQQIVYLAQFGNGVQVIHGELGAGKTTYFSRLLERDFGGAAIGVQAADGSSLEVFLAAVLTQLGLRPDPHSTRGELIAAMRAFVQTLHKERSRTVLLVDDAHLLSDSELGALISLLQGHAEPGVGLHIVMFAAPGFAARIDALEVLDVEVQDAPLPPLSPSEVHSLLQQLAPRLGFSLDSPEQAQRLWHMSNGLPGRALELARQLQPSPASERLQLLRGLPLGHFAALVLLTGILIWAFLVRDSTPSPQTEAKPIAIPQVAGPQEIAAPVAPATAPEAIPSTLPDPDVAAAGAASGELEPAAQTTAPVTDAAAQSAAANPQPADVTPAAVPDAVPATTGANFDVEEATTTDAAKVPQDQRRADPPPAAGNKAAKPAAPPPPQNKAAGTGAKGATAADPVAADEQELLRFAASGFALQLMASSTPEALRAYVAQQPNRKHLRMYRSLRGGKTLYIAVEGFYADKAAAQAAIANLPQHQRKAEPWPKAVEQIHREIRAARSQ